MKLAHTQLTENELQKRHYAFPEKRKFPLPDREHVLSAIKFFNYASPTEEKILADAILKRMRELGMSDVNVGPTNKFRKYYSGSELKHYGVKGMHWGVWNEETKNKYGTSGYTMKKGSNIRRFTSEREARRGTDMSKRFYAVNNQNDFNKYATTLDTLPGTSLRYKQPGKLNSFLNPLASNKVINKKVGVVTYEAIDDVHIAKGKAVLDKIIKDYGDVPVKELYDNIGLAYEREQLGLNKNDTIKNVQMSKAISDKTKMHAARMLVADVMSATNENSSRYYTINGKWKEVKSPGKKVLDEFKKQGYDAIEDIEDQLSTNESFRPDHPLIIMNGDKFRITNTKLVNRKKFKN